MMGTLAAVMAGKKIATPEDRYWADVEGDIEAVNNVLKITRIRVKYHLKVPGDKVADARESFANYITRCPAAQSVMNCIEIKDELMIEEAT
ncbi:MAG TPA: OsmC family protein [Syntrophales bacterium]|nr:OsmC family protein [Syntrophales bacterium]HOX94283.1 OsmC family protein [Syntrophales bacterium]HPI56217.1 OsmC family protein [Syntrophales bacterium]HPN24405.1 OsmC family protein [Syntrophales bacterium]HQM29035.1 OsmC family protein [Syntrophales bacterium]